VKEGDKNTSYFFALANQRKRKKSISCLVNEGVTLSENKDMPEHVMGFYNKLFGKEAKSNIRLAPDFWEGEERVTSEDNLRLEGEFLEEEILKAIKDSYAEGAPCPDGFSFLFYQKF
jgi:hypothetical protein